MAGLVGYGSSEEEQDLNNQHQRRSGGTTSRLYYESTTKVPDTLNASCSERSVLNGNGKTIGQTPSGAEPTRTPLVGPQALPIRSTHGDIENPDPLSPYTSDRLAVRNLTLPPFPNLDIPPSPPGSPLPDMTQKFDSFLQLKKQGIHFNEKLASSSALKNPMLLQKLTTSAGLAVGDQYATALPTDIWDYTAFPDWAYKEGLAKSQQQIAERRKAESTRTQRERLDFVPAGRFENLAHGHGSASATETKGSRAGAPRE